MEEQKRINDDHKKSISEALGKAEPVKVRMESTYSWGSHGNVKIQCVSVVMGYCVK